MRKSRKDGVLNTCTECGLRYYVSPSHREKSTYCSRPCRAKGQTKWQTKDLASRFWEKVNKTETCWLWTGAKLRTGYGSIRIDHKAERAHRVAYELSVGKIPSGFLILHSCDNPLCVNPDHLRVGDKRANTKDAIERGQHSVGELDKKSKLSKEAVLTIRIAANNGVSGRFLAKQFGICESHVSGIKNGFHRKHDHPQTVSIVPTSCDDASDPALP